MENQARAPHFISDLNQHRRSIHRKEHKGTRLPLIIATSTLHNRHCQKDVELPIAAPRGGGQAMQVLER